MGLDGWRTEVQALQKLHHPNIIRLMGSVYHPNPLTFCLVLEYCDAGDLDTAMQRVTPRNFVPHVAMSMAKGMAYLHKRGIIHRDIKPLNVLLSGNVSGGHFEVKVTDFGVSTESTQGGLRTAETGTYRWMVSISDAFGSCLLLLFSHSHILRIGSRGNSSRSLQRDSRCIFLWCCTLAANNPGAAVRGQIHV